ncbi:MAG: hypothetical protein ACO3RU_13640 [Planctomycetota bacterium]
MTEYDDLPFAPADTTPVVPTPKKCKRHRWLTEWHPFLERNVTSCSRCNKAKDEAAARRGRSSRNRGNAAERGIAKRWGGERRGQYGGAEDVIVAGLWVIQSKHGASYWPKRLVSALDALPRTEGRVPLLVVGDGSPGRHVRRLVILDERDWLDLHGSEPKHYLEDGWLHPGDADYPYEEVGA